MNRGLLSVDEETRLRASTWRERIGADFVERWTIESEVRNKGGKNESLRAAPNLTFTATGHSAGIRRLAGVLAFVLRIQAEKPERIFCRKPSPKEILGPSHNHSNL